MGKHDSHLPKRPADKAANPADIKDVSLEVKKRAAHVVGARRKRDAKDAKAGRGE